MTSNKLGSFIFSIVCYSETNTMFCMLDLLPCSVPWRVAGRGTHWVRFSIRQREDLIRTTYTELQITLSQVLPMMMSWSLQEGVVATAWLTSLPPLLNCQPTSRLICNQCHVINALSHVTSVRISMCVMNSGCNISPNMNYASTTSRKRMLHHNKCGKRVITLIVNCSLISRVACFQVLVTLSHLKVCVAAGLQLVMNVT